jgi:hypothetical protein
MSKIKEFSLIQITPTVFSAMVFLVFPLEILDKKNFKISLAAMFYPSLGGTFVLLEIAELQ